MAEPKTSRRYIVSGRVQGVGFRYFVSEAARQTGVQGWVRNRFDGTVEIRAEGADTAMRRFLDRIRSGPRWSVVENVSVEEAEIEDFSNFSVRF